MVRTIMVVPVRRRSGLIKTSLGALSLMSFC